MRLLAPAVELLLADAADVGDVAGALADAVAGLVDAPIFVK
jgi:hypothetical protein